MGLFQKLTQWISPNENQSTDMVAAQPTPIESPLPAVQEKANVSKAEGAIHIERPPMTIDALKSVQDYVVFDTETTGLDGKSDKIVEIALLKVKDGEIVDEYCTLINPQCPINPRASAVNHIYDDDVCDAPVYGEVGPIVAEFLDSCFLIGHNINFDLSFMPGLMKSVNLSHDITWHCIDTLVLARRVYPSFPNHKLQTLVKRLNLDVKGAHRARADAVATMQLFELCRDGFIQSAEDDSDDLLDKAIDIVFTTGSASASALQRELKIGYSRASRLMDQMEMHNIVGPFEGSKPRKVLITREQWEEKRK